MSRYRGPRLRLQRRLGIRLADLTKKRIRNRKRQNSLPGQHSYPRRRIRLSEFRMRLEEKQKLRFNYSVTERQLFRYIKEARRIKGSTGLIILQLLEMRLDTIVYRLNFARTILAARQLVSHGHIQVNQKVVTIASFQCQPGDQVSVSQNKVSKGLIKDNLKANLKSRQLRYPPGHLIFTKSKMQGRIRKVVDRRAIRLPVNELLVVEYYSRR